ncbi:MAG: type II toxin-antitoxin system HicA family toxin [Roseovarius sp.]|nr:type II toxin-antitoxin system HicA family toxin [Roseovarius sp.]
MAGYERKVKKLIEEAGYKVQRNPRGSHVIWRKNGRLIVVPAKIEKRHTANAVLKEAGISRKL